MFGLNSGRIFGNHWGCHGNGSRHDIFPIRNPAEMGFIGNVLFFVYPFFKPTGKSPKSVQEKRGTFCHQEWFNVYGLSVDGWRLCVDLLAIVEWTSTWCRAMSRQLVETSGGPTPVALLCTRFAQTGRAQWSSVAWCCVNQPSLWNHFSWFWWEPWVKTNNMGILLSWLKVS